MVRVSHQKQLGILLDEKLNFKQYVDNTIVKVNKGKSVITTLRHSLPRKSLVTIYKAFLQPLIDMEISSVTNLKIDTFIKN